MRTKNAKKSAITAFISNLIKIFLGFFCQKIFLYILGTKILGLNGLFNNIISMLAITELGIGSAIIYNLYDPIAKDDKIKIRSIMTFYEKSYRIISFIIFMLGLLMIPFLPYFAGEKISFMYVYYLIFLLDTLGSYVIASKISLINAYQQNYVVNIIHIIYLLFMNIFQIIILLFTKSYALFLAIKMLSRVLENIMISSEYDKRFNWLKDEKSNELDPKTKDDIINKVKALFLHKISTFLVTGTDNLIISKILGLITVGLYSNYNMIIGSIQNLFSQIFNSIISSIGNLLTEKDVNKSYFIYRCTLLANYLIISFCGICLYFLIEPFICIWIGEEYILSKYVLLVLILVFYWNGMRNAPASFKTAAGIFVEDKFVPLIESAVNLIFSIILAIKYGLIGVFIGTFLSSMILHLYSYPIFVYKKLFKKNYVSYLFEQGKFFILFVIEFILVYLILNSIMINSHLLRFIINSIVCLIIPNVVNFILFFKGEEFNFLINKFLRKKV